MHETGVRTPVIDLFQQEGLGPVDVLIHGGDKGYHEGESWRVPKQDLVWALQVLLQTGRLKVAGKLKLGPVLSQEMLNFRVLIDPMTAHDSYSGWWRENGPKETPIPSPGVVRKRSKWRWMTG